MSISRRDLLKSLSLTAAAGSALRLVRLDAAEQVHRMISAEKAASTFLHINTRRCRRCARLSFRRTMKPAGRLRPAHPNSLIC
jgi:hypothetical protein